MLNKYLPSLPLGICFFMIKWNVEYKAFRWLVLGSVINFINYFIKGSNKLQSGFNKITIFPVYFENNKILVSMLPKILLGYGFVGFFFFSLLSPQISIFWKRNFSHVEISGIVGSARELGSVLSLCHAQHSTPKSVSVSLLALAVQWAESVGHSLLREQFFAITPSWPELARWI